jgi:hypothetical protein
MKEYLLLFRGGDNPGMEGGSPEQMQTYMMKWMHWMEGLKEQGKLIGAQPLEMSGMQIRGTKKIVSDGPFMEGKEMVGGYLMCKANDYKEAVEISKGCPILEDDGHVEVREIRELKMN